MKGKIVFIGEYAFPSDMASCNRVLNMAKACQLAGYDTIIIGRGSLPLGMDIAEYKGVKYTAMLKNRPGTNNRIKNFFMRGNLYYDTLQKYASDARFIIPYACSCPYQVKSILEFGKNTNTKIICDISEWYNFRQFRGINGKLKYIIFEYSFRNIFKKCDGIICCSQFVRRYFEKRNKNILVLNGIIDINEHDPDLSVNNDQCVLIYAGSPGRKDYLIQFIKAYEILDDTTAQKVSIQIIGPKEQDIKKLNRKLGNKQSRSIDIFPRIPREKLIEKIREANFSILLRPNKRYANAGFPSKLCESTALGTPMMTNITGDIGSYMTEENAVIIEKADVHSVAQAMKRAANMDKGEYSRMRQKAYCVAKEHFDIVVCEKKIRIFLDKL